MTGDKASQMGEVISVAFLNIPRLGGGRLHIGSGLGQIPNFRFAYSLCHPLGVVIDSLQFIEDLHLHGVCRQPVWLFCDKALRLMQLGSPYKSINLDFHADNRACRRWIVLRNGLHGRAHSFSYFTMNINEHILGVFADVYALIYALVTELYHIALHQISNRFEMVGSSHEVHKFLRLLLG